MISPSLLCFLPPPTHIPPLPPSPLPLTNARMGQERAHSSLTPTPAHCTNATDAHPSTSPFVNSPCVFPSPRRGMWANDMPCHCRNPPPHRSLPMVTPNHMSPLKRPAYATSQDPYPPLYHLKLVHRPHHGQRRPPTTTSSKSSVYATTTDDDDRSRRRV
jgi:hypothetical protein